MPSWGEILNRVNSQGTIDGVRRSLSSFFTFLEIEDYIVKSPTRRIHKIKTEFIRYNIWYIIYNG